MFITDFSKVNKYVSQIEKKLSSPKVTRYLQFGTKAAVKGQPMLRDQMGLAITKDCILQSAKNFYTFTEGRDEFARAYKNFSVNQPSTGHEQVSSVRTVGAMDLTILAMSQSIIPFISLDRSMATPEVTIYYNDLVSLSKDGVGGMRNGEVVNGNFAVPNPKVDLGPEFDETVAASDDGAATVTANAKVIPGTVAVTVKKADGTEYTGRDYTATDGQIFFAGPAGVTAATVDYETGTVTVTGADVKTVQVQLKKDTQADNTGDTTLKVANQWTSIQLKADPQNIILNDNLMNRMYMQNTQMIATAGAGGTSAADVLFARTKNTYIEYLNAKVIKEMMKGFTNVGGSEKDPTDAVFLDLSDYSVNNWAVTKNDLVSQLINNLRAKFLGTNNLSGSCLVTGSYGVSLLANIPNLWTPNSDSGLGQNGLAGYFAGMPVYRHSYVDSVTPNGRVQFYMTAKTPDNNSGSLVYGEFLPLTSTGVVSNFNQPVNISNGFFSQVGVKKVTPRLVMRASLLTPASGLFASIY